MRNTYLLLAIAVVLPLSISLYASPEAAALRARLPGENKMMIYAAGVLIGLALAKVVLEWFKPGRGGSAAH